MKMLHVTIQTAKFAEEIRFYQDMAGLQIVRDMREAGTDIVFLADGEGETCIEVINAPEAGNAGNDQLSIGFKAEDLDQMKTKLTREGYETSPMISPDPHVRFFFTPDPA